jgi:hypothetical protein
MKHCTVLYVGAIRNRRRDDLRPLGNSVLPGQWGWLLLDGVAATGDLGALRGCSSIRVHQAVRRFLRSRVDGLRNDGQCHFYR